MIISLIIKRARWNERNVTTVLLDLHLKNPPEARIVLQNRELYLTSVSGTVRSNAWNGRKILRRILVHNETAPSDSSGRSSSLQFSENSFCNAIHDFFYWISSRHCPYTCWKYVKYILPFEGVEMFYVYFLAKLKLGSQTQMYFIWKIFVQLYFKSLTIYLCCSDERTL